MHYELWTINSYFVIDRKSSELKGELAEYLATLARYAVREQRPYLVVVVGEVLCRDVNVEVFPLIAQREADDALWTDFLYVANYLPGGWREYDVCLLVVGGGLGTQRAAYPELCLAAPFSPKGAYKK